MTTAREFYRRPGGNVSRRTRTNAAGGVMVTQLNFHCRRCRLLASHECRGNHDAAGVAADPKLHCWRPSAAAGAAGRDGAAGTEADGRAAPVRLNMHRSSYYVIPPHRRLTVNGVSQFCRDECAALTTNGGRCPGLAGAVAGVPFCCTQIFQPRRRGRWEAERTEFGTVWRPRAGER
jgi:hypothetical protein